MRTMAFYGKGGIGKSTVVTNLCALFARSGKRVLLIGCDPKSDSCYGLVQGRISTVMDPWIELGESNLKLSDFLMKGSHGIDCIEVGGPTPGSGCGGRGITKAFELIGDPDSLRSKYDVILFDVLGDVVCGGFSAPMRSGYAEEVFLVTSGELRALFAANNISQAVKKCSLNGARMGGLIGNLKGLENEEERINELAQLIGTKVVHTIPKDPAVTEAELKRLPCVDHSTTSEASKAFGVLFDRIAKLTKDDLKIPRPLLRSEFDRTFLQVD